MIRTYAAWSNKEQKESNELAPIINHGFVQTDWCGRSEDRCDSWKYICMRRMGKEVRNIWNAHVSLCLQQPYARHKLSMHVNLLSPGNCSLRWKKTFPRRINSSSLRAKGFPLSANESWAPRKVVFPYLRSQSPAWPLQSCSLQKFNQCQRMKNRKK